MRRILGILVVLVFCAAGAFAQSFNFTTFQGDFQTFATDIANALPFNASIGNNWSDAYIGQLIGVPPHFGVGVTAGATTIPYAAVEKLLGSLGVTLPSSLDFVKTYGVPIPAYTIDARIGGFLLPFDVGVKVGYLPPEALASMPFQADYILAGGDIRYAILQDGLLPGLSVGVGYTYMKGRVALPGVLSGPVTLTSFQFPDSSTHTVGFTNPSLNFAWDTSVIDLKVQLSKSLLIITPYLGAGASYGISNAGGGLASSMTIDGLPATQADIDAINQATGQSMTLQNQSIIVKSSANGWAFRAWGGFSLNILVLKIDVNALYNFTSGSLGATVGARIQI
jgi:hypothetical protein